MTEIHSIDDVLDQMRQDLERAMTAAAASRQKADADATAAADLKRTLEGFERWIRAVGHDQLVMPVGGAGYPQSPHSNGGPTSREDRIAVIFGDGSRRRDWTAETLLEEFRRRNWDDPSLKNELGAMKQSLYRMRARKKIAKGKTPGTFRRLPHQGDGSTDAATSLERASEVREEVAL